MTLPDVKVTCTGKDNFQPSPQGHVTVAFHGDYDDGQPDHSDWGPQLGFRLVLPKSMGDQFEPGKQYTLTFTEEAGDQA